MQYQIPNEKFNIKYDTDDTEKVYFNHEWEFPIKKICEIDIVCILDYTCFISQNKKNIICDLVIKSNNCWSFEKDNDENLKKEYKELLNTRVFKIDDHRQLTKSEYEEIQNSVKNIFKNIYFDKMFGEFLFNSNEKQNNEMYLFVDEMIGDNPLIEKIYNDCCICYEKTITKVNCCKGFICIQCWSKIKTKCQICNCCNLISCPLCRNIININIPF